MRIIILLCLVTLYGATSSHPYLYNPYYKFFSYSNPYYNSLGNYAPYSHSYHSGVYSDPILTNYLSQPNFLPTLNILAEVPYEINNKFTVVPLLVMAKENMNMVNSAHIMDISSKKPTMTVKTGNALLQATPAVKVVLDTPIFVYSLKTSIVFPSEIRILHEDFKIPIRIGAVIAPVTQTTFVSTETPIAITVVYAIPTEPIIFDYVNNNEGVIVDSDTQAVIVESEPSSFLPAKNITILTFPEAEAEPILQVDEEDEDLINRNPPIVLAPAGIVQSTAPLISVEPFINSKESPFLTTLREEANKHRFRS